MNWQVIVDNSARKYLKCIPKSDAHRIANVLTELSGDPYAGDVEKMRGEGNAWRRRIGSYRILFETRLDSKSIYVLSIKRRASKTY